MTLNATEYGEIQITRGDYRRSTKEVPWYWANEENCRVVQRLQTHMQSKEFSTWASKVFTGTTRTPLDLITEHSFAINPNSRRSDYVFASFTLDNIIEEFMVADCKPDEAKVLKHLQHLTRLWVKDLPDDDDRAEDATDTGSIETPVHSLTHSKRPRVSILPPLGENWSRE